MAGWWNPWWYGAYRWLADPAEPALDPGFWNLRGAVDRVVLPPPSEQVGTLLSGWPHTLIVESSGVTASGPDDPSPSSLVSGPWRTPTGGVDDAPWNQESVLRVMSHVAPVPAAFWSRYGRLTLIPFAGRSHEIDVIADSVEPPAEYGYSNASPFSFVAQGLWLLMPRGWSSRNVAIALLGQLSGAPSDAPPPPSALKQVQVQQYLDSRDSRPPIAARVRSVLSQEAEARKKEAEADAKAKTELGRRMEDARSFGDQALYARYKDAFDRYDALKRQHVYIQYLLDPEGVSEPVAALAVSYPEIWQAFVQKYGLPGVARLETVVRWGWKVGANDSMWRQSYVYPSERTAEFRTVWRGQPLPAATVADWLYNAIHHKDIKLPQTKPNGDDGPPTAGDFQRWHGNGAHSSLQQAIAQIQELQTEIRNAILLEVATGPLPSAAVKLMPDRVKWIKNGVRVLTHTDGSTTCIKDGISVVYNGKGFPDFRRFLYKGPDGLSEVTITLATSGSKSARRKAGEAAANLAAGFSKTPKDYVWHHHEDVGRMPVGVARGSQAVLASRRLFTWKPVSED